LDYMWAEALKVNESDDKNLDLDKI